MEIQVQQRKADEVLSKLKDLCPCFVAGGAPANWYQGLGANDIDVFVTYPHPDHLTLEEVLGVKLSPLKWNEYEDLGFIGYEWEDEDGQKFQLLLHEIHNIQELFNKFSFSVCRAAYLGRGEFIYGDLFELSIKYKFLADSLLPCPETFLEKYRVKYPPEEWYWICGGRKHVLTSLGRKWQSEYTSGT